MREWSTSTFANLTCVCDMYNNMAPEVVLKSHLHFLPSGRLSRTPIGSEWRYEGNAAYRYSRRAQCWLFVWSLLLLFFSARTFLHGADKTIVRNCSYEMVAQPSRSPSAAMNLHPSSQWSTRSADGTGVK